MFHRPSPKRVPSTGWVSALFALVCLVFPGCSPYGKTDAGLVGTWRAGAPQETSAKYSFRADGSYDSTVFPIGQSALGSASSTSGKWGVKDGILRIGTSHQVTAEYQYTLEADTTPKILNLKMISLVNVGTRRLEPVKQGTERFEKVD